MFAVNMRTGTLQGHRSLRALVCFALLSCAGVGQAPQRLLPETPVDLQTTSVAPLRFIAAHGRRALISGYASGGLEVWAYPFEIFNDYRVCFRVSGTTTAIDGATILRRVTYSRDSITRLYLGPDFTVRETLFVPLNEPGGIITYAVQSARPVLIDVHAAPILNLMWPAGIGGQSTAWNAALSAFILSEPSSGYTAVVGSPDIIAHDDSGNRTSQGSSGPSVGFTMRPSDAGEASVYIALNPPTATNPATLFRNLIAKRPAYYKEYDEHVARLMDTMIAVTTPDEQVNEAIAWSELALDQAWVCNRDLGCGYVAGYGPSRGARRPQYDWFFAGDGLIAANASASAGNVSQARDEFEFILRYQDKKTGMIWHELSQSAGFLDWAGKYPYMYVHVDITFQFLTALAHYVETTGDQQFAIDHWSAIAAAYHYCETLTDPATALPRIPSNKEGGDEQDRMSDDLGLSTSWIAATGAFQQLATWTGHAAEAANADVANGRARTSIPKRYWDAQTSFWISGHLESGRVAPERRSGPSEAISMNLFSSAQQRLLLDQLASSAFQTDWGSRGVAAGSGGFDPTSYAKGSVSALGTTELADTFWAQHRSTQAFALWNSLIPWTSLDSLGHLHEVLAGNTYQPQEESVPEQTWSSAGFVESSIHGLLGLQVDALQGKVIFAPRIPATWHELSIAHVPLSGAAISFTLRQSKTELDLKIENSGPAFLLKFSPTLPLGAAVISTEVNGRKAGATVEEDLPDTVATLDREIPRGVTVVHMALRGGLSILPPKSRPLLGDASRSAHIVDVALKGDSLTITADVPSDRVATIDVATDWTMLDATQASVDSITPELKRITFQPSANTPVVDGTQRVVAGFQVKR